MIIVNLILLASIIFFRTIFFPGISTNPIIGALIITLGVFISVVMVLKFIFFCLSRKIPLHSIVNETGFILTNDDGARGIKGFCEIGVIIVMSSAILNRKSVPFFAHFFLDSLVLTGFLIYLYTLQYLIINLQAKLMRVYPKLES